MHVHESLGPYLLVHDAPPQTERPQAISIPPDIPPGLEQLQQEPGNVLLPAAMEAPPVPLLRKPPPWQEAAPLAAAAAVEAVVAAEEEEKAAAKAERASGPVLGPDGKPEKGPTQL